MQKATFGAGCFWGVEAEFAKVPGVTDTAVGFMGGHVPDPSYKRVCKGDTGHAEVVQVEYDPRQVTYEQLLEVFWSIHNPTDRNGSTAASRSQYRSVIFYHTREQHASARAALERLQQSGRYERPIATEIAPAGPFYKAEDYHQHYYERRGVARCRH